MIGDLKMCNGVQFGYACLAQLKYLCNFKYFGGPIGNEHVPSRWRFDDLDFASPKYYTHNAWMHIQLLSIDLCGN